MLRRSDEQLPVIDEVMDCPDQGGLYTNFGRKREASGFASIARQTKPLHLRAAAQLRHVRFDCDGRVPLETQRNTFLNYERAARSLRPTDVSPYVQDGTRLPLPGRTALAAAHWRARQESGVPVRTISGDNWPDRTRMAERVVAEYLC